MSLALTGRRAEQFALLLDGGGHSDDPTLAPLASFATALQTLPRPAGPSEEFRTALRQRLVAVATVQGIGATATTAPAAARMREVGGTWKFQRRMAVLAGGAAAVTAIAGVGIGASRSLPGDAFYGIKRATEDVQLSLTFGQEAKGKRHLEFARTRLNEVADLVNAPTALGGLAPGHADAAGSLPSSADAGTIRDTLSDMDSETRAGANDLYQVAVSSGSSEPLQALNKFTQVQYRELTAVLPSLPLAAQTRARQSLTLLVVVSNQTVQIAQAQIANGGGSGGGTGGAGGGSGQGPGSVGPDSFPTVPQPGQSIPGGVGGGPFGSSTSPGQQPPLGPSDVPTIPGVLPTVPISPTVPPLPTHIPTHLPTSLPSLPVPTSVPTSIVPTKLPTVNPTKVPTKLPSIVPTKLPTKLPSIVPTKLPTVPTKLPSVPVPSPSLPGLG